VLTLAQRQVVEWPAGPVLALGGAGSGKTTALRERFAHLVEHGVEPDRILFLTYAPAQADALREALEDRLRQPYEEIVVTTFAGLCARLLRDEGLEAGIDPFVTPVSAADRVAMLLERIDELALARHDLRGNPSALIGGVIARIDRLKEELVSCEDYAAWANGLGDDAEGGREREFAALYAAHDRMLAEAGSLDTGDLVLNAFRLLRERPEAGARAAARFAHVLVDELQEASYAQGALLRMLVEAGTGSNVWAAGDPSQAIHRFRGAAHKSVEDFRAQWPAALEVELEGTFRRPETTAFWRCATERAQAQAVAAEVERLVVREDVAPESVCVLVRSIKSEGQAVALALEERAVPYALTGAAAFFQRAEVRDLLAWLRLLVDPGDAGAVVRALARAPVELRSVDIARCTQIARRRKLDMVSALGAALESPQVPPEARERIATFLRLHRAAAAALDSTRPDLYVHRLIERLGLRRQLLFAASTEVVERLVNLAKFGELAAAYVRRSPQATAREFARSIAAVAEAGLREEEAVAGERPRGVQVMSMHAAKGLEFDHVYVLGLIAARIPGPRRRTIDPIPDALIAETVPPDSKATHVAGMRRLVHVATTRARRRLTLAYPEETSAGAGQHPSPLAEELREALGGEWELREEELFGPAETLQSTFRLLRDELLTTVSQVGGRLGELRFDTDLDVSHAVVRYLELIKLASLLERTREGQAVADALPVVNAALLQAATAEQREILETSALDEYLSTPSATRSCAPARWRAAAEPSLSLPPRAGRGLLLSASDIDTYRTCPLKYKFARGLPHPAGADAQPALRDPRAPVLERFHGRRPSRRRRSPRCSRSSRRAGAGAASAIRGGDAAPSEGDPRAHPLPRALPDETAEPVWFERSFSFRMGPHLAARARGPGRPARGRRLRAHRLQDGPPEVRRATRHGRAAVALRGRCARELAAGGRPAGLLLRARRREGARRPRRSGPRVDRGDGGRGGRGDPRAGIRADALVERLLDVRLPDRLSGRGAVALLARDLPYTGEAIGARPRNPSVASVAAASTESTRYGTASVVASASDAPPEAPTAAPAAQERFVSP
jgi:DNA helicase-2/ATP-dependent DNA helicase PcrA